MKISPIRPAISKKQQVIQSIKRGFWFTGMAFSALGEAIYDSFTRGKPYYVEVNGKMVNERDLPNYVSRHDEWTNAKWEKIIFSPEDRKKIDALPMEQRGELRAQLIRQGKYTLKEIS